MTTYTEPFRPYEVLISEANGSLSRESVTIVSGAGVLSAGTVLGKITKAGTASAAAYAGNTGNGTMGAITVGAGAKPGVYKLTITELATDAGNFVVEDPDGITIGQGDVAAAFSAGGLAFTLADGATDFAAGDGFTITVAAGSGKYASYDNTATDGTEVADAVLLQYVDATSADVAANCAVRICEVKDVALQWHANNNAGAKTAGKADMAAKFIIAR